MDLTGERLILGGHAATSSVEALNPGYHSRKVASQSPFKTRVQIPLDRLHGLQRLVGSLAPMEQKFTLSSNSWENIGF
jgi:hypothetical protein